MIQNIMSVRKSRQQPIRAMKAGHEPTLIRSMGAAAVLATAAETPGESKRLVSMPFAVCAKLCPQLTSHHEISQEALNGLLLRWGRHVEVCLGV